MQEQQAGFDAPRPTSDPYVRAQYLQAGLEPAPSLAAIEPHATEMMRTGKILEGIGMVLGRHISAGELQEDKVMQGIAGLAILYPEEAFGLLLLQRETKQAEEDEALHDALDELETIRANRYIAEAHNYIELPGGALLHTYEDDEGIMHRQLLDGGLLPRDVRDSILADIDDHGTGPDAAPQTNISFIPSPQRLEQQYGAEAARVTLADPTPAAVQSANFALRVMTTAPDAAQYDRLIRRTQDFLRNYTDDPSEQLPYSFDEAHAIVALMAHYADQLDDSRMYDRARTHLAVGYFLQSQLRKRND